MKRKWISILLCVALSVTLLAGCGGSKESAETEEASVVEEVTEETQEETETEEIAEEEAEVTDEHSCILISVGLNETEIEEFFALVANDVLEQYLEPNNIAIQDFEWPDCDTDENLAEWDYQFAYLYHIIAEYNGFYPNVSIEQTLDDKYSLREMLSSMDSLSESDLMNIVSESIFKSYVRFYEKCNCDEFENINWYNELSNHITFSDEQIALGKSLSTT